MVSRGYLIILCSLGLGVQLLPAQDSNYQYVEEEKIQPNQRKILLSERQFQRAELLAGEGDYANAIALYSSAIQSDYRNLEAYYGRAVAYEQLKNYRAALLDYELALQIDDTFTEARFNRGIAHYKLENYSQAIRDFSVLLNSEQTETRAIFFKDENLSDTPEEGKVGGVSTLYSMRPTFFNYRGLAYLNIEKYDSALFNFTKAIALQPQNADFWSNRARVHMAKGENEEAIYNFQKALQFDSNHSQAKYNLSVLQADGTNLDVYFDAVNANNKMPSAYFNRGYAFFTEGDYEAAIADYDTTLQLKPDYLKAFINRGNAKSKLKRYKAAIKDFDKAHALNPSEVGVYSGRGNAYFRLKQYQKAIIDYSRALTLQGNQPALYYNRGLAYFNIGQKEKACDDLRLAVRLGVTAAKLPLEKYCK